MITVEDCRRKAAQWLDKAQSTADPKTIASMRRASDAWMTLAEQMEHATLRQPRGTAHMKRPAGLAQARSAYPRDPAHVGDVLRERLQLGEDGPDDNAQ